MKIYKIILIIILFFIYSDVFGKNICGYDAQKSIIILRNDKIITSFDVGVAAKKEFYSKGLMFCKSFDLKSGLLFIYPDSKPRSFWMKNTSIPLGIIFISPELKIISIREGLPFESTPVTEKKPVKYVLEVNYSDSFSLKPEDSVIIEDF